MSKITFRADDDLIRQLEAFDASKSEVMREALREYLSDHGGGSPAGREADESTAGSTTADTIDELVAERIDEAVAEGLGRAYTSPGPQDVNVHISIDGDTAEVSSGSNEARKTPTAEHEAPPGDVGSACKQCGESLSASDVYCSNCGEKTAHRIFCECGDELRSDWGFCPGCGRRTPAADVLRDS